MEINYERLPAHMRSSTKLYIEEGIQPGDFLTAVICNDLFRALRAADHINKECLNDWHSFFYHEAPTHCFGSKEKMEMWCESGGLHGLEDNDG